MTRFLVLVLAILLPLAGLSTPALAASPSEVAAAQALFDEGRRLMAERRYAEACPKFEESQRLDPAWGTAINLADCYDKNGRTASAWIQYMEVAAGAEQAGQSERARVASERARQLEMKLSKLSIVVPPEHRVAELKVARDGVNVGAAQWGVSVPVDPGQHLIEASAPGHKAWRVQVVVRDEKEQREVQVPKLVPLPSSSKQDVDIVSASVENDSGSTQQKPQDQGGQALGTQKILGIVTAGVGVAALGTAGFFALRALHYKDEAGCRNGNECENEEQKEDLDRAVNYGNLATGFSIGGAALVVGGAVLYFTAPSAKSSVSIRPSVGPTALGLWVSGKY